MKIRVAATALAGAVSLLSRVTATANTPDAAFYAQTNAAMSKMMTRMGIKPSGDVDHDFEAMMVAHHQGAIGMAAAELRFGRNIALRRIAQEIVVTQSDEITAMRSKSLLWAERAIPVFERIGDRTGIALLHSHLANGYRQRGRLEEADAELSRAHEMISDTLEPTAYLSMLHRRLSKPCVDRSLRRAKS